MTAVALTPPPLTVADFLVLEEDERYHCELQEGVVMVTNKPKPRHQRVLGRLFAALDVAAPDDLVVLLDISVDLQLAAPSAPGFVRAPDLVVVRREAYERIGREGGVLRASDVVLVVEILSPSTRRVDTRVQHDEYADAGVGHYWMVDLDGGPSLTACHSGSILAPQAPLGGGAFGYVDAAPLTGVFVTDVPFPARIDLGALG